MERRREEDAVGDGGDAGRDPSISPIEIATTTSTV
jgi:hypothetical protein